MSDDDRMEGFDIGEGVLRELSRDIYDKPTVALREMVQNSLDQYELRYTISDPTKAGQPVFSDKQKIVTITLDKLRRLLICVDSATGIEDGKLADFKRIGNIDTEGTTGKTVGEDVSSYTVTDPSIVGHKHIGKLSCCFASRDGEVEFYSNNGTGEEGGIKLVLRAKIGKRMKKNGWKQLIYAKPTDALEHVGLKVKIINVKDELLDVKEVIKLLAEWFGIRIARGKAHIFVKNEDTGEVIKVQKPQELDTDSEVRSDSNLQLTNGKYITCRLVPVSAKSPNAGKIYAYVKYVRVRLLPLVDYLVTGWVNCDYLEVTAGRDKFVRDSEILGDQVLYSEFDTKLNRYFEIERFEKMNAPRQDKLKNEKDLTELFSRGLETFAQLFENPVPLIGKKKETGKPSGGDIESGNKDKKTEQLENQKLIRRPSGIDNGNGSGVTIIPIGGGSGGGGGGGGGTGGPGTEKGGGIGTSLEIESGGTRTVLSITRNQESKQKEPVKPEMHIDIDKFGNKPTLSMSSSETAQLNTERPASDIILMASGNKFSSMALPLVSKAIIEFETRNKNVGIQEGLDMWETLLNRMWGS